MEKGDSSPDKRVRLGDFEIQKKVGEGGMGTVFMARQISLDRVVALKILPKSFAENPEFVERFRREARAAASLIHPNVVQVYSVGEERGVPYFAMEFVDGRSLEEAIKSGVRYSIRDAARLAAGVARALEAAHEKGLVHRDIKPANIMLDNKENVKVTDFGLAKPSSGSLDITQPGLVVGTPTYMSPEQGAGEDCGTTSDIYSLGVVLYEMLVGAVPFASENVGTIIYKHLHEAPEPPSRFNPNIPKPLEQLVLKCLGKHPEDRYASPGELVGALNAFIKGETSTDPTMMLSSAGIAASAPRPGDGPGSSDVTMPTPAPVAVQRQTPPPPTATPQPTATPATLMQPIQPRKGRGTLKGFVAALVLVAGAAATYHYWPRIQPYVRQYTGIEFSKPGPGAGPNPGPESGPVAGPGADPDPVSPTNGENLFELNLAPLKGLLPAGGKVELIAGGKTRTINLSSPPSLKLPAGSCQLNFSRPGYHSATWRIALSSRGLDPALTAESVSAKPTDELAKPYLKAEQLLQSTKARDAASALENLKEVAAIDSSFRETARLRTKAEKLLAEAEKRWKTGLQTAEALTKQNRWTEAKATYKRIVDETPVDHRLHDIAQRSQDRAGEKIAKIATLVAELTTRVAKGQCEAPKIAGLRKQLLSLSAETSAMTGLFDKAAKSDTALTKANTEYLNGKFEAAARLFDDVLKLSPQCTKANELRMRCDKLVKTTNKIERAVGAAEGQYRAGDYRACLLALDKLTGQKLGEFEKKVSALRAQAQQSLETSKVEVQLGRMDSAFAGLDFSVLKKDVVDFTPAGATFLKGFEAQFQSLASSGIEISTWKHKLESLKVERSPQGAPLKATASTTWNFELKMTDINKSLTCSMPMQMTFKRLGEQWLLAAAAPRGKPTARSAGAGPARSKITGKLTAIKGKILTIDRGKSHGVAVGMVFNVFTQARVVQLPLTGEKLFVEERTLAVAEVVEVAEQSARCSLAPDTPADAAKQIRVGMPVALSPAKSVARTFPVIAGISASAPSAPAGVNVRITLDVKPLPGVFVTYKWSAPGGVLSARQTSGPSVNWRAPATKGAYSISVTVATPSGEQQRHAVTVNSTGTAAPKPKAYDLEATLCSASLLQGCNDIAFDAKGYAYVLDGRQKRVVFFDPSFRPLGSSERFESSAGFGRVAIYKGKIYCLDTKASAVKRYDIGQTIQFKKAEKTIGGKGTGNGRLAAPLDLAFSRSGELYVLDAPVGAPSVQVFSRDGKYVQSFGSPSTGTGRLVQPVAVVVDDAGTVHVLDAGRRKVISFRDGRPLRAFSCGAKTGQLTDLTYDPTTDSLLVVDAMLGQALVYGTGGSRRGSQALGAKSGLASLRGSTRIAANRAGSVLAVTSAGKFLSRFTVDGRFRGAIGGAPLSANCKIAAGPRETLLALDTSTALVRVFDRNGWLLSEFGGRKTIKKAADLVCDTKGIVYILDAGTQNIKAFDLAGRPQGTYGKKGRVPQGMENVTDMATDGSERLAVLCYENQESIFHYGIGARTPSRGWPPEKKSTNSPKLIAVDTEGRTFMLNKKGQVNVWDAGKKNLGIWPIAFRSGEDMAACAGRVFVLDSRSKLVMACDAGGGELARIAIPKSCTKAADIAPSDYEVLYLYDAGSKSILKYRAKR